MATGGRVLHHLAHALPDARNTVLFAGYQSAGTRGRALEGRRQILAHPRRGRAGARADRVDRLHVRACGQQRNHAVARRGSPGRPPLTCLVHGEPVPMDTLKARIERELGWTVKTPAHQEKMEL